MTRLSDTILGDVAYAQGSEAPVVNLNYGSAFGPTVDFTTYYSNTPYVRRNIIAILLSAPTGFQYLDNPDIWVSTLKTLIEVHAQTISGLNRTYEWEYSNVPVGGAGEIMQTVTGATRTRSEPQFTWPEKYGAAINKFLEGWGTNLIMDPETRYARIVASNNVPADFLADFSGATVLFFEPDPPMKKVIRSWLSTNMQPLTAGEVTGSFDMTQAFETQSLQVTFTALTQIGAGVDQYAQTVLDSINKSGMNPNTIKAFQTSISSDVAAQNVGFATQLNNNANNSVTL